MTHPIFSEPFSEEKLIEAKARAYNEIMTDLKAWAEGRAMRSWTEWVAQSN